MANNNKNKILNVPNLRFPEFSGEWKKFSIEKLCDEFKSGKNIKADNILVDGAYPVYGGNGLRGFTDSYNHDGNYVLIGRQGALCGNVRFVTGKTYITEHAIAVQANKNNNTRFLEYLFVRLNLGQFSDQSAQPGLAVNKLLRIETFVPTVSEQERIVQLLQVIDERITTQNKIIDKLQSLIKGLAVTLTTKGKPNTTISQCLECHSSTLQESEVLPNGLCKVFGANGLVGYKDVPQMNGDAILVIKDGSGVGTVSYAQGEFSVIGTLNYLTIIDNNDLRYLYFALSVFNFQPYKTGMAIPHIYFKDYGKAKIYCPPLAEQKRVANVLDKLESKLFVEQELLASFNQQKQYLLGQMFI